MLDKLVACDVWWDVLDSDTVVLNRASSQVRFERQSPRLHDEKEAEAEKEDAR